MSQITIDPSTPTDDSIEPSGRNAIDFTEPTFPTSVFLASIRPHRWQSVSRQVAAANVAPKSTTTGHVKSASRTGRPSECHCLG